MAGSDLRILFCGDTFPAAAPLLRRRLPAGDEVRIGERPPWASDGVDVVIPLMSRVDASVMEAGRPRLIQQWGAGLDGVDLAAARARGIWVASVPSSGGNADSVAEHAVMLMLALLRRLPEARTSLEARVLGAPMGRMLQSATVCLYGLGAIALSLARRLKAFEARLIGITRDPHAAKVAAYGLDACYSTLERDAALGQSDVLVVCTRLVPETSGLIDARALAALPKGSLFVNLARGGLVEYAALTEALASGHLAGAGLDVFWTEPIDTADPLLALPNVIATPHVAGVTDRSYGQIADFVAGNVERLRRGEPPLNLSP